MNGNSCTLSPKVNGEDSKLYKELLSVKKISRPQTNYLYAYYTSSNLASAMDQVMKNGRPKYRRNSQGEHSATDMLDYIGYSNWVSNINSLASIERQIGAVDQNGNRIDYTDAEQALSIAKRLNDSSEGLVATVTQHGNIYNVLVNEKNSRTHTWGPKVEGKLQAWNIYKQAFANIGIDITNMPSELASVFSAYNTDLIKHLQNLKRYQIGYLDKKNAMILFNLYPNSRQVQNIINSFGSIENAAEELVKITNRTSNATQAQRRLLLRAVLYCQQFLGLDLNSIESQVEQATQSSMANSGEQTIKTELERLNKKYKIDADEIHRISTDINTLSEALADATLALQRQIRKLEKENGANAEGKRLTGILNQLMTELRNKKYCSGIVHFMGEASTHLTAIDSLIANIPQTGTEMEKFFETAKILQNIKSVMDQFYPIIDALSSKALVIDENISQIDIDNIKQTARSLKEGFDSKKETIKGLSKEAMKNFLTIVIGDTAPDGQYISNLVEAATADSTLFDYLYSVGTVSNPMVAAMGSVIRNAQNSRDKVINDLSIRIRRATDTLYKAGYNSEFMYEDDGHIISDINWPLYKEARKRQIKYLKQQGLKGFDLKQAIEDWEEINTEDREVDTVNHRFERVPDSKFRKQFPSLSRAQKVYYDTMMQIKGEIGTLLPEYARHHYLPPQVRRSMLDALAKAKNAGDVWHAIKLKFENLYKIREDDTNYSANGIIDGDEYHLAEGDFDNTPLRQIPIFFVNKVEQGELLKNFSTGLQALAGTAVNYDAMNEIKDVVEFVGDFITDPNRKSIGDVKQAEVVQNQQLKVFKDLWKYARNTNTEALVDGFISQHMYGEKQVEKSGWSKLWRNIIGYTSFKGLTSNVKGMIANYLVGEMQMLIEAGAGEFYGIKNYLWAHTKLIGGSGVGGELAELLTNNMTHKGTLLRELFDPLNENFSEKSHKKYYKSAFRQLVSHDCSFIGYASGEYLIHYVNMYAILDNTKVLLNGKKINLYDAYEVKNPVEGNSELHLKQGVTTLDGEQITDEWIDAVRRKIRYCNQTTHGAMNEEDKGLIHRRWWGRGVMNFRQWMVGHYSRRFRARHFDDSLGMEREGYWRSFWKMYRSDDTAEAWREGRRGDAIGLFMKDFYTFAFRAQAEWANLDDMQRYNVKRVLSEMAVFASLLGFSFALGEPEDHKKEVWRRWTIYETRRMLLETQASMPHPKALSSILTILQAPMAGINTVNSLLYTWYGLTNGDVTKTLKSGKHKGENKYIRNMLKYNFPFFKDWEQMQSIGEDETIFQVFKDTPSNH